MLPVIDGPKCSPVSRDAVFMRASDLISALSIPVADESELLACGLTEDELADLQYIQSSTMMTTSTAKVAGKQHKRAKQNDWR